MGFGDSDVLKNERPSKDLAWWVPNIDHRITPKIREILETYGGIPPDEVVAHVYNIREKAWNIRPWPCTGMGQFFSSSLPQHTSYASVLSLLRSGAAHFLDLGCYSNLHGLDLVNHWDLGYDLYRDRQTFNVEYIEADLLAPPSSQMRAVLQGKIDIFGATHLLHNWDWGTQVRAVSNIVALSKVGSLVVGFQVGTRNEGVKWDVDNGKEKPAFHSLGTFERVWEEAGRATGTKWSVEGRLREWGMLGYREGETAYLGEDSQILEFAARRVG
ncbi:hypothetical protein K491DRAFT_771846 [Lophiostoma macrostomum CBS 122681]|uniref:Methyltransferase domain-containing protein n=1 Tax=Lophiostoma macrostomum CBS 122681 TaxID=1314788 RepID=A0A6A6SMY2_9PLEO|nr:hypothetical protein K491DRAFT_771846 [Lophiostoma macrostomum CBS 122681]